MPGLPPATPPPTSADLPSPPPRTLPSFPTPTTTSKPNDLVEVDTQPHHDLTLTRSRSCHSTVSSINIDRHFRRPASDGDGRGGWKWREKSKKKADRQSMEGISLPSNALTKPDRGRRNEANGGGGSGRRSLLSSLLWGSTPSRVTRQPSDSDRHTPFLRFFKRNAAVGPFMEVKENPDARDVGKSLAVPMETVLEGDVGIIV
ncbi:hypothetical protein HK104_008261 [Borealophlyctis nickersoniae]|nr:hypothetical protein HK104_008261 [Borealophlyctis nickersoniae]